MVYCKNCDKGSDQDYVCPYCRERLIQGWKITYQFKNGSCDRCHNPISYHEYPVWRVNTSYYHWECYEKINPSILKSTQSGKPESKPQTTSDKLPTSDWPTVDMIDRAFENLQKNTPHKEIKDFYVVHDNMNLPLSYPGAFARVYKIQKNTNFAALRFFTIKKEEIRSRYKKLHDYFEKNFQEKDKPQFIIDFKYLPEAIKIIIKKNEVLFDLIMMEWIEGETMENFMIRCKDKNEIKMVKEKFKKTIDEMEKYGIAHGDLHPKNILIDKNHEIKLVDYDCMYVEDFKGSSMPELGDLDTQHPNRASFKYDNTVDRFSALVLYLALMIIEEEPDFSNIRDGDFIFKKEDYLNTDNSDTFKKLEMFSKDVRNILQILISYCEQENPKIDTLSSILKKTQKL